MSSKVSGFKIKDKLIVGDLKPSRGNPRNSEGSFLQLKDGRIAFAYSRYTGNSDHDDAACDICVIYSRDKGYTFDCENFDTLVSASEYGERNVMSVTLRTMNNGDIGLFYLLKHDDLTTEYILRRYRNDFTQLIGEVKCLPFDINGYFVVNNDRVLGTSDGRWIIPAAYHLSSQNHGNYIDGRADVCFFMSDDDGITWQQGCSGNDGFAWYKSHDMIKMSDPYTKTGLQEPGLTELKNGALYCYSRTDRCFQYESVSVDGGGHWSIPQPSRFMSPDSPMLIKQNPYSGLYYAFWNPTPISFSHTKDMVTFGRYPYVMAQSVDGVCFTEPVILEDDPSKGYCYPAVLFLDEKEMLISYCCGNSDDGLCLDRTVLCRLIIE